MRAAAKEHISAKMSYYPPKVGHHQCRARRKQDRWGTIHKLLEKPFAGQAGLDAGFEPTAMWFCLVNATEAGSMESIQMWIWRQRAGEGAGEWRQVSPEHASRAGCRVCQAEFARALMHEKNTHKTGASLAFLLHECFIPIQKSNIRALQHQPGYFPWDCPALLNIHTPPISSRHAGRWALYITAKHRQLPKSAINLLCRCAARTKCCRKRQKPNSAIVKLLCAHTTAYI